MNRHSLFLCSAALLVGGLALALVFGLSAAAAPAGEPTAPATLPAPAAAPPLDSPTRNIITFTFDADNMRWLARNNTTTTEIFEWAPWQSGRIYYGFSNRRVGDLLGDDTMDYGHLHSWVFDHPLSGRNGTISFEHELQGDIPAVNFSVCLIHHSTGIFPEAQPIPCSQWQPVANGPVTLTLQSELFRQTCNNYSFYPRPPCAPLSEAQMAYVLSRLTGIWINYIATTPCPEADLSCRRQSTVYLDNLTIDLRGPTGKLGASTFYAQDGDTIVFYAALKDAEGQPIRSSDQVTMTLTGKPGSVPMLDEGAAPDDGVYTRWETLTGAGVKTAAVYYRGHKLDELEVTVIAHPHLIVLTDISALYHAFLDTGMPAGQDDDGDGEIDFIQLLGHLAEYAARHKGVVYDVRENIDTAHGFPVNYADLNFGGADPATNRFRRAQLIDEALTRMHRAAQHTIADVVIIGADDVIPFYRIRDTSSTRFGLTPGVDTPTAIDLAAGYIVTDVPYGTVDYVNQGAVTRPYPQIPVGRVTAAIPMGMIERLDAYNQPIVLDPQGSSAALFVPADGRVAWDWLDRNMWTPLFTAHYALRDYRTAPPFNPGYYRFNGNQGPWGPAQVLDALRANSLTVLSTHTYNWCDQTASPTPICGNDYGALATQGGRLYVIEATLSGFSPAFYSPSGNRDWFDHAIPRWVQYRHRTEVGSAWVVAGYNSSIGMSDYLMSNFVAQALSGDVSTVGDAFVHAWDGYWTSTGSDLPRGRSVAYSPILWGLPTQPIWHRAGGAAQAADLTPYPLSSEERGKEAPALDRTLTVEISTPNFRVEADATGALLVQPANGGRTYAEGPGQPLLPQVVRQFLLPPGATNIRVTEDTAGRVSQAYGAARLQTAQEHVDCDGQCTIGAAEAAAAALPAAAPAQPFTFTVEARPDAVVLTLAAVPAQYSDAGQLTLFTRMRFTVSYALPTAPAVAITGLTVNNGQAVRAGTAAVPLALDVTASAARPISVTWAVGDPSGFTIGGGQATANLPAGASRINLTLDAARWTPGPKLLSVRVTDADNTLDTANAAIQVLGLRLAAEPDSTRMAVGRPVALTVRAWDENGAAVTGLAGRLTVQVDGAARAVTFTEGPAGQYRGSLSTAGLTMGAHEVTVAATDTRGLRAEAWTAFDLARLSYMPLVLRR